MISFLRERLQGIVAFSFLIIVALTFAFLGLPTFTQTFNNNDYAQIGKYSILFKNESKNNSKNFISDEVNFRVNDSRNEFNLMAEKRYYPVSKSVMTEAAIKPSIKEDLYISIGDKVEDGWAVKAQVKPFIRLIWLGALIMGIGGMFGIL